MKFLFLSIQITVIISKKRPEKRAASKDRRGGPRALHSWYKSVRRALARFLFPLSLGSDFLQQIKHISCQLKFSSFHELLGTRTCQSGFHLIVGSNSHFLWFDITTLSGWLKKKTINSINFVQSEVKPKPIMPRSHTFSRASCRLQIFTSSLDWFAGLSVFLMSGQSYYLAFGWTTLNRLINRPNLYKLYLITGQKG